MTLSPDYIVNGLVKRGIPRNAALGFAGNFAVESRFDPTINEIAPLVKGSRGGFGLAQWTGPRRRQLEAFAGSKGKSVMDPEVQMDFLAWELQNTEKGAAKSIFAAKDPMEAARLVSERFLRPGIPHLDRRLSATAEIAGGTFTGGGGSDTLAGGGSDTLSGDEIDMDALLAWANGQQPDQPAAPADQPAKPTLAEVYNSTGALDVGDVDMDALLSWANQAQAAPDAGMTPIATTPDGGQVFRMANGQLAFKSPGYATNDQAAIARIMEGATPIDEVQATTDALTISQNPIAARVQEFNQGVPFVGEWLDEAVGAVSPTAGKAMRQTSDAMERQNPVESGALNLAGGVAYTLPLIAGSASTKAADFINRGANWFTKGLRAGAVAAPAGATETAATFAGRAEEGKRGEQAVVGGVVGAGVAGVLGALAPAIGTTVTELAKRVKRLDVSTIADEFGLSKPAARVVKGYLLNDDLDAAAAAIARGGDDAMLANAGPATRQALDTAAASGGEALSVTRKRVGDAVSGASNRFINVLDDVLGKATGGIKDAAREIAQRTAPARKAAYDAAYAQPTPMTGEAGERLQSVLSRISPDDFNAAIREANAEMLDRGYKNQNIMASIADDGTITFSQPLSVLQLDHIARGLANVVEKGTDPLTGAMSPAARRASGQLADLRGVLKESIPGYRDALRIGGDAAQAREALSLGRKILNQSTTPDDLLTFLRRGLPDDAKAALRKGMRENLEAVMGNARTTIADLESGAMDFASGQNATAEALAAVRNLLTRNNMTKARLVLGKADAEKLFAEMERVADVLVLRSSVARGSATAIRQAGQQQMSDEVAPGILRRTLGNAGNPLDAARDITREIAGIDPRSMSDQQRQYFAEIADALTRIKGADAQRALASVRAAMQGQPIKDAEAQLIGRLVAGGVALPGYQAATAGRGQ